MRPNLYIVVLVAILVIFVGLGARYIDDRQFCSSAANLGPQYSPDRLLQIANQEGRPKRGPYTVNGTPFPADPPAHDAVVGDIAVRYARTCI